MLLLVELLGLFKLEDCLVELLGCMSQFVVGLADGRFLGGYGLEMKG